MSLVLRKSTVPVIFDLVTVVSLTGTEVESSGLVIVVFAVVFIVRLADVNSSVSLIAAGLKLVAVFVIKVET
jgi:hypothetical protein